MLLAPFPSECDILAGLWHGAWEPNSNRAQCLARISWPPVPQRAVRGMPLSSIPTLPRAASAQRHTDLEGQMPSPASS